MNLYNKRTAARIARENRIRNERMILQPTAIMRKTLIVKTWDGRDLYREVVTAKAAELDRAYGKALERAQARFKRAYFFCDHSEGVAVQ